MQEYVTQIWQLDFSERMKYEDKETKDQDERPSEKDTQRVTWKV
jgi:hypothetical protein